MGYDSQKTPKYCVALRLLRGFRRFEISSGDLGGNRKFHPEVIEAAGPNME
jgi:hypothetical protein